MKSKTYTSWHRAIKVFEGKKQIATLICPTIDELEKTSCIVEALGYVEIDSPEMIESKKGE
jgi:hypothetical protein